MPSTDPLKQCHVNSFMSSSSLSLDLITVRQRRGNAGGWFHSEKEQVQNYPLESRFIRRPGIMTMGAMIKALEGTRALERDSTLY